MSLILLHRIEYECYLNCNPMHAYLRISPTLHRGIYSRVNVHRIAWFLTLLTSQIPSLTPVCKHYEACTLMHNSNMSG